VRSKKIAGKSSKEELRDKEGELLTNSIKQKLGILQFSLFDKK